MKGWESLVSDKQTEKNQTVVGYSTLVGISLYGVLGAIGLVTGYFLPMLITWALKLPWMPFEGPLKLINEFNGPWLQYVLAALGLIAGIVVANIAVKETLIVTFTDQELQLVRGEHKRTIARADIDKVFLDGKQLVILGKSGTEIAREKNDESAKKLAKNFSNAAAKHGYPWVPEGDPYKEQYRRWVLDTPDISAAANAVLKAREIALQKKAVKDVDDLRKELMKMGYIIRDEETRQYWRTMPDKTRTS
jgi:hypothetical protein